MKKVLFLVILLGGFIYEGSAATYYTRGTGSWTGMIWGTTTTGAGGLLPALNDGDVLYIDDNISIDSNLPDISADITIIISATLSFGNGGAKIQVGEGSVFQLTSTGTIAGVSDSNQIRIGNGPAEWDASDGPITGPGYFSQGWQCPPCALPVKLLFFKAEGKNSDVVALSWATTMEEDFLKFVIQRSADGVNYENIGELKGRGFNIYDIESRYTFVDERPLLGTTYYRLKGVDIDDTYEFSQVRAVKMNGPKKLAAYPNPSNGESINFSVNFNAQESDRIYLIDQLGVEVFSGSASSANTIRFANALKPGVYMLRYVSRDFDRVSRIVVTH